MPERTLEICQIDDPCLLAEVYRQRVLAWRERLDKFSSAEAWLDEYDEAITTRHWVAREQDQIVAAARLTVVMAAHLMPNAEIFPPVVLDQASGPYAVVGRLFVRASHAGLGLARKLDEERVGVAKATGCQIILGATNAGEKRIAQMEALGFENVGPARPYNSGPLSALPAATIMRMWCS